MTAWMRWIRRRLGAPWVGALWRGHTTFERQGSQFATAQTVIRCFYAFLLYFAITQFTELSTLEARGAFAPLWPALWLRWMPAEAGARALFAFYVVASAACALAPGRRIARIAAWVGILEFVALKNSNGKIGHSLHLLVLVAGLLIFLPAAWDGAPSQTRRATRQATLLVFWACQAAILLAYTMSGLGKLGGALYQIAAGQPSAFSPGALGALVAQRLVQTHSESALGAWIIGHPWLTWPMMPSALYLELFAFWVAFRPALHRLWAALLITFHAGTFLTMTITFPQNCLLLALFFFPTPFQPVSVSWWEIGMSMPLFGGLLRARHKPAAPA